MEITRLTTLVAASLLLISGSYASSRILDGEDANSGQFPWVTSVRIDNSHKCVGSIIGEKYVLTSAQCVAEINDTPVKASRVNVRCGSINQFSGGTIVPVDAIHIHPLFGNYLHNIAVLVLTDPLSFAGGKIKKIDLAGEDEEIAEGVVVTVAGWGLQNSDASPYKLQHASYSIMSKEECELRAGFGYTSTLCLAHAEKEGICRGDEGAGIVSDGKLVGTASFAFGSCGSKFPDVASKVSYYSEWIASIIA